MRRDSVSHGRFAAAILCGVVGACVSCACDLTETSEHTDVHRRHQTELMLEGLGASTMDAVMNSDQYAPVQRLSYVQWLFTHDPRAQTSIQLGSLRFDAKRQVFLDAWGTPVLLIIESGVLVGFGSCGPNLRWDSGGGDDITVRLVEMGVPIGPPGEAFRNRGNQ